jgi:hypothetical protein
MFTAFMSSSAFSIIFTSGDLALAGRLVAAALLVAADATFLAGTFLAGALVTVLLTAVLPTAALLDFLAGDLAGDVFRTADFLAVVLDLLDFFLAVAMRASVVKFFWLQVRV